MWIIYLSYYTNYPKLLSILDYEINSIDFNVSPFRQLLYILQFCFFNIIIQSIKPLHINIMLWSLQFT
jgi:hypothetical protein